MTLCSRKIATQSTLGVGALISLGALYYAGQSVRSLLSGFTAWVILPYAVFSVACSLVRTRGVALIIFVVSVMAVLCAGFIYVDALFLHSSSTSALVFIFIPLYQVIAAGVMLVISFFSRRLVAKPTT